MSSGVSKGSKGVVAAARTTGLGALSWPRRPIMRKLVCVMTTVPSWSRRSKRNCTRPMEGRDWDTRADSTSARALSTMPGRTGLSHFTSSMPGAPRPSDMLRKPSQFSRMRIAQLCQPDADRPPRMERCAAFSSRWKGCGSKAVAKVTISSFVTG